MGRLAYFLPFHDQETTRTSVTLGFEAYSPQQARNAHERSECENSLSFPNTMAAANLSLFVKSQG